jgi:hypothetical protein
MDMLGTENDQFSYSSAITKAGEYLKSKDLENAFRWVAVSWLQAGHDDNKICETVLILAKVWSSSGRYDFALDFVNRILSRWPNCTDAVELKKIVDAELEKTVSKKK